VHSISMSSLERSAGSSGTETISTRPGTTARSTGRPPNRARSECVSAH
jgi:hypothetical protein